MTSELRLTGSTEYNRKFPPRDAKKGYVARITGRASGALKFAREFYGEEAVILPGDEGLFERQIGEKKGGCTRYYHVIVSHPEHGLIKSTDCKDETTKIAKLLDDGVAIGDAVEVCNLRPSERTEGLYIFDVRARTAAQAKQSVKAASVESATEHCWDALKLLPEKEAKAVLAALKSRVSPPKPVQSDPTQTPVTE